MVAGGGNRDRMRGVGGIPRRQTNKRTLDMKKILILAAVVFTGAFLASQPARASLECTNKSVINLADCTKGGCTKGGCTNKFNVLLVDCTKGGCTNKLTVDLADCTKGGCTNKVSRSNG